MSFDFDAIGAAFALLLIMSLVHERSLAPLFAWRFWLTRFEGRGLKVPVALLWAYLLVTAAQFDILVWLFSLPSPTVVGKIATAGTVAGGAQGVMLMFQRLLEAKAQTATSLTERTTSSSSTVSTSSAAAQGGSRVDT